MRLVKLRRAVVEQAYSEGDDGEDAAQPMPLVGAESYLPGI